MILGQLLLDPRWQVEPLSGPFARDAGLLELPIPETGCEAALFAWIDLPRVAAATTHRTLEPWAGRGSIAPRPVAVGGGMPVRSAPGAQMEAALRAGGLRLGARLISPYPGLAMPDALAARAQPDEAWHYLPLIVHLGARRFGRLDHAHILVTDGSGAAPGRHRLAIFDRDEAGRIALQLSWHKGAAAQLWPLLSRLDPRARAMTSIRGLLDRAAAALADGSIVVWQWFPPSPAANAAQSASAASAAAPVNTTALRQLPVVPAARPRAEVDLSWYEAQLIDELEDPIPGVMLTMTTPGGTRTLPTGGDGVVRVDQVPPGTATMRIMDMGQCADAMTGWEQKSRRKVTLPPPGPLFQRTTMKRAGQEFEFPDAHRFVLMLVTRTDIVHGAHTPGWDRLAMAGAENGPWTSNFGKLNAISLFSNAKGLNYTVANPPPDPPPVPAPLDLDPRLDPPAPPDGVNTDWIDVAFAWPAADPAPDTSDWHSASNDDLHEALFDQDWDTAASILQPIPTAAPPNPVPDWPAPDAEARAFHNAMVASAQAGNWDPLPSEDGYDASPPDPVA